MSVNVDDTNAWNLQITAIVFRGSIQLDPLTHAQECNIHSSPLPARNSRSNRYEAVNFEIIGCFKTIVLLI